MAPCRRFAPPLRAESSPYYIFSVHNGAESPRSVLCGSVSLRSAFPPVTRVGASRLRCSSVTYCPVIRKPSPLHIFCSISTLIRPPLFFLLSLHPSTLRLRPLRIYSLPSYILCLLYPPPPPLRHGSFHPRTMSAFPLSAPILYRPFPLYLSHIGLSFPLLHLPVVLWLHGFNPFCRRHFPPLFNSSSSPSSSFLSRRPHFALSSALLSLVPLALYSFSLKSICRPIPSPPLYQLPLTVRTDISISRASCASNRIQIPPSN